MEVTILAKGKYKRKRLLKKLREVPIRDSGLSEFIIKALEKAGINTMADLIKRSESEIKAVHGIGDKAFTEIQNIINKRKAE